MADYDWFDRDLTKQQPSDAKVYGEYAGFSVTDKDTKKMHAKVSPNAKNEEIQAYAKSAWCDFCQCSVRPYVWAMRQHRHICLIDPRAAGIEESAGSEGGYSRGAETMDEVSESTKEHYLLSLSPEIGAEVKRKTEEMRKAHGAALGDNYVISD